MRERLEDMAGVEVCRTLSRNELPPAEFDATQREYNNVCAWARRVVRSLPEEPPASLEGSGLDQPPGHRSVALQEMFAALGHDLSEYRRYQQSARDLQSSSERNDLELTVAFVAPFLLATALALRITKVTGELRPGA